MVQERFGCEWLAQVAYHANGSRQRTGRQFVRQEHNGDKAAPQLLIDAMQHLFSIDTRNVEVENDQVGLLLKEETQPMMKIDGLSHFQANCFQIGSDQLAQTPVALNSQHICSHWASILPCRSLECR